MAVETRIMNCIMCPLGCEMTVTIEDGAVTSVTGNTCPRGAAALRQIAVKAPVTEGQIIVENILGLGVDIIASRSMEAHR